MPAMMSLKNEEGHNLELGTFKVEIDQNEEPTEFPCRVCSAKFVTRMSLIRHMILHEDDENDSNNLNHQKVKMEEEEEEESYSSSSSSSPPSLSASSSVPHIPEQNLLETILKNGSKSVNGSSSSIDKKVSNNNEGSNRASARRPIPNLKPLPSLIQINKSGQQQHRQQQPLQQQPEKNLPCSLCGVWFRKKEDLSRHVTRTHGSAKFTCPYCQRNISRRDHLKRHIKNVHPEFCTATEVGPFINQGAGRPPKQTRAEMDEVEPQQPPPKRRKLMNGTSSSSIETPILQNFLTTQTEIQNQISFITESKIEAESESDDTNCNYDENEQIMLTNSQLSFSIGTTSSDNHHNNYDDQEEEQADQYQVDENELLDEEGLDFRSKINNGFNHHDDMMIKPEFNGEPNFGVGGDEDEEEEEEEEEPQEQDLDGIYGMSGSVSDLGFGMIPEEEEEDSINNTYSENHENGNNGLSEEFEQESILKPLLGGGPTERKFKCGLCDAAFNLKLNMQRHMSTHSVARPHKCTVCGKGFLRKEHLTKHLSSVHSGLKYRCQFCRKDISRKDHLLRHIRNCHPQEFMGMSLDMIDSVPQISQVPAVTLSDNPNLRVAALSCDMCNELFNHIDELMEHQSDAHADIRKFRCETCPKSFKRKEHLVKHLSTHAPPVPKSYNCSECNQAFPSLAIAHAHLRQVHGQKTSSNNKAFNTKTCNTALSSPAITTSLPCNLCDNTFQQRTHLLQHLKAYHGVSNPERRFTDASFNNNNVAPTPTSTALPRQMISIPKTKPKQVSHQQQQQQGSHHHHSQKIVNSSSSVVDKPQIRSLLGIHSLMGLINKGSISLSLSKIGK